MSNALPQQEPAETMESSARGDLAQSDASVRAIPGLVRQLLTAGDNPLFCEDVIASVRGMIADLARQLVEVLPARGGGELTAVRAALANQPQLLAQTHAVAMEWRLLERMQVQSHVDPVKPPLVAALLASGNAEVSGAAMDMLAAQARFWRARQRVSLPLDELSDDLLDEAIAAATGVLPGSDVASARQRLIGKREGSPRRTELARHLIKAMGGDISEALSITEAGPSFFLSSLAAASDQSRRSMVIATDPTQIGRLALSLRAAGLGMSAACEQILSIHPTATLPVSVLELDHASAKSILASSYASKERVE